MYSSQSHWVELYSALMDYEGPDVFSDVLKSWAGVQAHERCWLADFAKRGAGPATNEELCRLYAASRVTETLLLRFQTGSADGSEYNGPAISLDELQQFHEMMGFRIPKPTAFHPYFHEIIAVKQSSHADAPIELVDQAWPVLMLGDMMYCRAGCVVAGGTNQLIKEIAERSKLYWAYRRKNRPYEDQSHGWGSNSQWRTRLRRDYQTSDGFRFNVDGDKSLNGITGNIDDDEVSTLLELVRHRCRILTHANDDEFYPYPYSYSELA